MHSLAQRCLQLAASGVEVDCDAYARHETELNMAKLKSLAMAYRQGWLHNVMRRITPLTVRSERDYVLMADLFVANPQQAEALMAQMSKDLSAFAAEAGINTHCPEAPEYALLGNHLAMFRNIGNVFCDKFGLCVPTPFASTTITATGTTTGAGQAAFVRQFMRRYAA